MDIVSSVSKLVTEDIEKNGYKIESITYEKESGIYYLRIIISKNGAITIDDCVTVSNIVNPILDKENITDDNYILDVCSK